MVLSNSTLDLRICVNPSKEDINPALINLVASGRGSLDFILGDTDRRIQLLADNIDWSRIVVAWKGDTPVGYAQMRFAKKSPYQVGFMVFIRKYGIARGVLAWLIFQLAELWNWQSPFYFYGLKVKLEERNQGIGEALVRAVMDHARNLGYTAIELDVGPNFIIAKRLYERCGFYEVGRAQLRGIARFLPFQELSYMRCDLSPKSHVDKSNM